VNRPVSNKHSLTADKRSSTLKIGREGGGMTPPHRKKRNLLRNGTQDIGLNQWRGVVNTVMSLCVP